MTSWLRAALTVLLAVGATGCLIPVPAHRWDDDHNHYRDRDDDHHHRGDRRWDNDRDYDRYERRDWRR